jgi:hypothetical protein
MALLEQLASLEEETASPRQIALLRKNLLEDGGAGLAFILVPLLKDALGSWLASQRLQTPIAAQANECKLHSIEDLPETDVLRRILRIHVNTTKQDPSLGEELGRQGSHALLVKLMNFDASAHCEEDQDAIMELQDLACEIAAIGIFPLKFAPLCVEDLRHRLPLDFSVEPVNECSSSKKPIANQGASETETILIHQVTTRQSAQHDVGFGKCSLLGTPDSFLED